ncbi:HNH endonuclease [Candidatus Methanoperedens nitratireducens]|nr:HNH endonuclease [Candidatus Methanoperedens nitroreducens]
MPPKAVRAVRDLIYWQYAREYIKERERPNECIYCGSGESLSTDHLIPRSRGGADIGDNAVIACKKCNSMLKSWRGCAIYAGWESYARRER